MKKFLVFTDKAIDFIIEEIEAQGALYISKDEYIDHIHSKDTVKARKYAKSWGTPIQKSRFSLDCKTGQNHGHVTIGTKSTRANMKTRMIICPPFNVRAKVGAFSWVVLKRLKTIFPEMFLAKTEIQITDYFSKLKDNPFTFEMDYSNYDATQNAFLRYCVDHRLSQALIRKGLVLGDVDPQ